MSEYRIDELSVGQLKRIKIPPFQRGFVWTRKKQEDFVQTLHDGYPFGTLLVYPENDNDKDSLLLLLDGQQRLSTIRKYQDNPLSFWKPLNREKYSEAYGKVNEALSESAQLTEAEFDSIVSDPGWTRWLLTADMVDKASGSLQIYDLISNLNASIKEYVDLEQLKIPMIVYLGSEDHIADVFANLNKGGVPLSKYEVFSAAWVGATIQLEPAEESVLQDRILQNVKNYYLDKKKEAEFDLASFSEDDLTQSRVVSLPEFGTALGQFIVDNLPALVPNTSSAAQELGFGLLGVAEGLDNRKLNTLNTYRDDIQNSLEDILQKTERICNNLQSMFDALLRRFKATGNDYENGLSATFKTLSYFAALWDFDPSSEEYRKALSNIKAYYVYDAITSAWSSHGDQRLLEFCNGKRDYNSKIEVENFRRAFDHWIGDQTPGINFSKEIKCLVTIHANLSYLSASVPNGESFELEHIIARKRIDSVDNPKSRRILGGSLGNCMYLPKTDNNAKKTKTLYDVNGHGQYSQLIVDSQYFTEEDMAAAGRMLESHDFEGINGLLKDRSRRVAYTLVDSLLAGVIKS
ncbi:DUF262 domain-containing protein [Bifidobacterium sp. CP2]|uniref:DUF262 domain-containing protein n=1 Tax=Bifidobacterium sp. CP2 TaxID=2809025 RepID=UPI001BDBB636|nr:DUF262 domain-containing protein [Bifidobacterium sp. CP2]MBT1181951.1 DUF262 domain-containing protein [Bifidobacterium sp. CP2]